MLLCRFNSHDKRVRFVALSPDGTGLASGLDNKTTRMWNVSTGDAIAPLDSHPDWLLNVS